MIRSSDDKIFVLGAESVLGKALIRLCRRQGRKNVASELTYGIDLTDQSSVRAWFKRENPGYVFLTHPKSGGIAANINRPAEFMYANLQIQNNVIHYCYECGVKKLLFLASSCVYPRQCPQPMREEYLLTGELEKTSEPYAIAKIAGVRMCQSYNRQYGVHYISVIPATVYGPDDHFDCEAGHVIPSLIERFHQAKLNNINKVTVWGTGKPRREFIYVDDLAEACLFLMENCDESEVVNVGVGYDVSIEELAHRISQIVAYKGHVEFDSSKPDGAPRKLLDCSRISGLGWMAQVGLEEGVALTYKSYRDEIEIR